ncbi:MAG: hypothetical protein FJZ67_00790 [Bacteroidetes bacterium]|nr:hypothetical protein [Bacteroidota bacterium]
MKLVFIWAVISCVFCITFFSMLLLGIFKKKRSAIIGSIFTLAMTVFSATWTVYIVVYKSYHRVTETLKPRSGKEIYSALFGESQNHCVNVLNHQDQVVPKIDYAIWLHVETCPRELKRILNLHEFTANKVSSLDLDENGPSWFKPQTLGDSILVFIYNKDEYGNGQTIYSSIDSSEIFCKDVWD